MMTLSLVSIQRACVTLFHLLFILFFLNIGPGGDLMCLAEEMRRHAPIAIRLKNTLGKSWKEERRRHRAGEQRGAETGVEE